MAHGVAGTGKTGVLRQVVEAEQAAGVVVLAVRLDRIEPATTAEAFGKNLGLEMSPVVAVGRVKQPTGYGVIVLDQVDSVCMTAGRHPEFLHGVAAVVREASLRKDISIVLACRTYDLEGDERLRAMVAEHKGKELAVLPLKRGAVSAVLEECGIDGSGLTEPQLRLLENPLHLFLLSELQPAHGHSAATSFRSGKDLLAAYWRRKPLLIRERRGRVPVWAPIFDALCTAMDRRGLLSVPESVLDAFDQEDIELLCSEHVLSRNGGRISFFHESFFDYAFARSFVSKGRDAAATFTEGDQGLLRRAQLRRVLSLLAEDDREEFRRVAAALLTATNVRFHLVVAVLDAFRELAAPEAADWQVLVEWSRANGELQPHIDAAVFGRAPWLDLFSHLGLAAEWLRSSERAEFAVRSMTATYAARPELVVSLLARWVDDGSSVPDLLGYAFEMCSPRSATEQTGSFFESLVDQGLLPAQIPSVLGGRGDFWRALRMSRKDDDVFTLRLAAKHLRQQCESDGWKEALSKSSDDAKDILTKSATAEPAAYLDLVGPLILETLKKSEVDVPEESPFKEDSVWRYRSLGPHYELRSVLLSLAVDAIRKLGSEGPVATKWLDLLESSTFSTAHFVVFSAATRGVTSDAEALRLLFLRRTEANALDIGYHDAPHQLAKLVFQVLSDSIDKTDFHKLAEAMLNYYPGVERGARGLGSVLQNRKSRRGYAQWQIFRGPKETKLPPAARKRKQELDRKFEESDEPASKMMRAQFVASPVPASATEHMDDAAWLGAIEKYDDEHRSHRFPLDGSVHELAWELEKSTQREPHRFAELAARFPVDVAPSYISAILRGVSDSDLSVSVLSRLISAAQQRADEDCAQAVSWLMQKKSELEWPRESLSALAHYAMEGRTPKDESWVTLATGGSWEDRDLLQQGINCGRGAALDAISRLLRAKIDRRSIFEPVLAEVAEHERCDEVRTCAVMCCTPLLGVAPEDACSLFASLVGPFDRVLASAPAQEFLLHAVRWATEDSVPLVEKSLRSRLPAAQKSGAMAAYVGGFHHTEVFSHLVPLDPSAGEAARTGAAEVLAEFAAAKGFGEAGIEQLTALLNDPSEAVRRAASRCLYTVKKDVERLSLLADRFYSTRAFVDDSYHLIDRLRSVKAAPINLSIRLGYEFLNRKAAEAADIRTHGAFEASHVAELVVAASARASGAEREECLNVLDGLLRIRAYGVVGAIDQALA